MAELNREFKNVNSSSVSTRAREPMFFVGHVGNQYVFQTPDGEVQHNLSKRAVDDLLDPNHELSYKVRYKGEMVDLYSKAELNKALGRPKNFKPIEGARLGVVYSKAWARNFNFSHS